MKPVTPPEKADTNNPLPPKEPVQGSTTLLRLYAFLILTVLLTGCSGCIHAYRTLKAEPSVSGMFITGDNLPDYHYFYTGPSRSPKAVIGIDPGLVLDSRFWHPITGRSAVVNLARNTGHWLRDNPQGFHILDESGHQVGIWFSHYWHATVRSGTGNRIEVYAPAEPAMPKGLKN